LDKNRWWLRVLILPRHATSALSQLIILGMALDASNAQPNRLDSLPDAEFCSPVASQTDSEHNVCFHGTITSTSEQQNDEIGNNAHMGPRYVLYRDSSTRPPREAGQARSCRASASSSLRRKDSQLLSISFCSALMVTARNLA
jgi:hypothetical protein